MIKHKIKITKKTKIIYATSALISFILILSIILINNKEIRKNKNEKIQEAADRIISSIKFANTTDLKPCAQIQPKDYSDSQKAWGLPKPTGYWVQRYIDKCFLESYQINKTKDWEKSEAISKSLNALNKANNSKLTNQWILYSMIFINNNTLENIETIISNQQLQTLETYFFISYALNNIGKYEDKKKEIATKGLELLKSKKSELTKETYNTFEKTFKLLSD